MAKKENYSKNYFTSKNILLYVVVGGLIYALIYYIFLSGKTGTNYYGMPQTTPVTVITMPKTMMVTLNPLNLSKETGTAVLTDESGKTKVVLTVTNEPVGASEPAHIHVGACPTPGAVKYPLSNVVNGTSETMLDVSIDTLRAGLPLAINVHKSAKLIGTYVSCGDLK